MKLLIRWAITAFALFVAAWLVPGISVDGSGWVLYAVALLERDPEPSDEAIRSAFAGLKCRCGAHSAILRAVKRVSAELQRA